MERRLRRLGAVIDDLFPIVHTVWRVSRLIRRPTPGCGAHQRRESLGDRTCRRTLEAVRAARLGLVVAPERVIPYVHYGEL